VVRRRLGFWRRFAVALVKPPLMVATRHEWSGTKHIPSTGGAIIVPNHVSHADPTVAAYYVYDSGRWPHFLAKSSLFSVPVLGALLRAVGQIPVYRGTADAIKALEAAIVAVDSGRVVIIYPEGTITEQPELWPMRGKTGVARLWLATRAPVIPLAMWGPQRIYDSHRSKLRLRFRTPILAQAGPPIDLSRWAGAPPTAQVLTDIADEIMLTLRDMLAALRGEQPPPLFTPSLRTAEGESTVDPTVEATVDRQAGT